MSIEGVSKAFLNYRLEVEGNKGKREAKSGNRLGMPELDSVDISEEAGSIKQTIANLKNAINNVPDTRESKIKEVRIRLQGGYYDQKDVIMQVAERIADVFHGNKKTIL